jgi:hypothetical protein
VKVADMVISSGTDWLNDQVHAGTFASAPAANLPTQPAAMAGPS